MAFMACKCSVASSSDWPPDRNAMPGTAPGTPGASIDEFAIREALERRLAKFKQPKRVFFVEALPRNAMGKVQKAALRKTYETAYAP